MQRNNAWSTRQNREANRVMVALETHARISTVIVNYNAGDWLLRAVQSALNYTSGHVYVVDNDSHDNSVNDTQTGLVDSSANKERLVWELNQSNTGFAAANNQVLQALETEYAVLMNPDCELREDTVKLILEQFKQHPKMGLASCTIYNDDGSVQPTCRRRFPTPWSALVRMTGLHRAQWFANFDYGDAPATEPVEFVEAISGAFMVARMSAVRDVGLMDEDYFMHCEDLDWCKRFHDADWQVGFVPKASVLHAKGVSSESRRVGVLINLHQSMVKFFDKHYQKQYNWLLRTVVKVGIYVTLCLRIIKLKLATFFALLIDKLKTLRSK